MRGTGTLEILLEPFYARDSFVRTRPGLREGSYALLSVRDNGIGMPEMVKGRAFEPFYTTKAPGTGTGLGLSMVHAIMRGHDGYVEIESEPGQGTEVRCLFPALAPESRSDEAAAPADERLPQGQGESVLLVEDEASLLRMGLRRLEDLGYRATGESDPRRALDAVRQSAFDLVVTDYTMPQMNGLDLAREISRLRPGTRIVLLTGFVEDVPPDTLAGAGIRRLLRKPQSLPELAAALRDALDAPPSGAAPA
jgi:CheY-like chemotaxis protein